MRSPKSKVITTCLERILYVLGVIFYRFWEKLHTALLSPDKITAFERQKVHRAIFFSSEIGLRIFLLQERKKFFGTLIVDTAY